MPGLPILHVTGTHYEVGFQIGTTFRGLIVDYVTNLSSLQDEILPYLATPAGADAYTKTEATLLKELPQYVEEIRGMAEGSGIPHKTLMALNMCKVFEFETPGGCTTITVAKEGGGYLAHNEDGPPDSVDKWFIINVNIPQTDNIPGEKFTALCYPGSLAGRCFGVTGEGTAWGLNAISPKTRKPGGIPRQFLSRLLTGQGLAAYQGLAHLSGDGCAISVYTKGQDSAVCLEVDKETCKTIDIKTGDLYVHCNTYLSIDSEVVPDVHLDSSIMRLNRIAGLIGGPQEFPGMFAGQGGPVGPSDIRGWLGDTTDAELPVYRDGSSKKDVLVTLATGLFDLSAGTMEVYVGNPKSVKPIYVEHF